ncbi:MAG: histidine kinase [Chitinophagaceae bacterium]
MKQLFLLLSIFVLTGGYTLSQDVSYRFINFNYKDGVHDKFFYDAVNDKNGLLWIASGSGIYSYDGARFSLFRTSNPQTGRESSNLIRSLYCDTDGKIWTAGLTSVQWFYPDTRLFRYHSPDNKSLKQLGASTINTFFRDSKGTMWIGTIKKGIAVLNERDSTVTCFKASDEAGAPANFITRIFETPGNAVWALSLDGLHLLSAKKGILQTFRNTRPNHHPAEENYFTDGFFDAAMNCIWIGSFGGGLIQFDLSSHQLIHHDIVHKKIIQNSINAIAPKSATELWIYNGNLSVYNKKTHTINNQIVPDAGNEFSFKTTGVGRMVTDKEGNIWFCSFSGISMLPWQNNQWQTILLRDQNNNNTILEPTNVCKIPGTDELLITTSGSSGIGYYNPDENQFNVIRIGNNESASSLCIAANTVYVVTEKDLYRFQPVTKTFTALQVKYNGQPLVGPVWRMINGGNNTLLIASPQNGFYRYHTDTRITEHFNIWDVDRSVNKTETENTLWPSFRDSKGNCWFTRGAYLYYADPGFGFHKIAYTETDSTAPVSYPIEITEDNQQHYWITTKTNGIYEWYKDKNGKEVINNYNTGNTPLLPSDYFLRIVKDDLGFLWMGSLSGLVKFDPVSKKVISVFRKKHGLVNDNIDVPMSLLPGNCLAVCNFGALNLLPLNNYQSNKQFPVPIVASFKVMDKPILLPFGKDTTITLSYDQNFLQFDLGALSYNNSDETTFSYQLKGADESPVNTNRNYVSYSALSNGTYTFTLKAANNDNVWSNKTLEIKIIIRPPFWKTWWFISLFSLAIAGFLYWINQNRISQIRKEEKLKSAFQQQIAETEMKALRAQMNPHFIFNSLNSIQKYILKNEHFEASQYLTKFSRLIRLILDHSNQNNILLSSELDLLRLYVEIESLRFDHKFDYEITIDPSINTETTEVPSMLIQPYVENAIWHGLLHKNEKGKLIIDFSKGDQNNLLVTIDDNGVGRMKAAELKSKQLLKNKSFGMKITEDRIQIINRTQHIHATCEVTDKKDDRGFAAGTSVKLSIPFQTLRNK